jgi:hypothetical protein
LSLEKIICPQRLFNYFKTEYPYVKIVLNNSNECMDDKSILINLLEKYGKANIINYLNKSNNFKHLNLYKSVNESYHTKSKRNVDIEYMDNVFMTPSDEYDTESGKFEYDFVPEKMSYSDMMLRYDDFCSNYIDAYDTEDEHWTFIYQNGQIVNQDGDNGKIQVGYGYDRTTVKRNEKALPIEERFKPIQKRGLVAMIYSDGDEERYWYKNVLGKELLTDYTGWSFEQPGDEWL